MISYYILMYSTLFLLNEETFIETIMDEIQLSDDINDR